MAELGPGDREGMGVWGGDEKQHLDWIAKAPEANRGTTPRLDAADSVGTLKPQRAARRD